MDKMGRIPRRYRPDARLMAPGCFENAVMNLKTVKIEDVVTHDVTIIRKGEFKGCAFICGHLIQPADICRLQRPGKRHICVWKTETGYMHEMMPQWLWMSPSAGMGSARRTNPGKAA